MQMKIIKRKNINKYFTGEFIKNKKIHQDIIRVIVESIIQYFIDKGIKIGLRTEFILRINEGNIENNDIIKYFKKIDDIFSIKSILISKKNIPFIKEGENIKISMLDKNGESIFRINVEDKNIRPNSIILNKKIGMGFKNIWTIKLKYDGIEDIKNNIDELLLFKNINNESLNKIEMEKKLKLEELLLLDDERKKEYNNLGTIEKKKFI